MNKIITISREYGAGGHSIGTKVADNEPNKAGVGMLSQFEGMSAADGTLAVGVNVDAVSGATVSSRGVTAGVNAALAVAGVMG